jgi:Fur family ferric uptake transcriptional regulator
MPLTAEAIQKLKEKMKGKGFKLTGPRRKILEYLAENDGHPSAQEIHAAIRQMLPGTGMATIYRTMDLLARLGLVRALVLNDNRLHYEIDRDGDHHHHLICTGCRRVEEFASCTFEHLIGDIESATRFVVKRHDLEAYGLCPDCAHKARCAGE